MTGVIPSFSAEVILKSKQGQSMVGNETPLTSNNIEEYRPSSKVMADAASRLNKLGFDTYPSDFTLTIIGKKALFEKVFKIKLAEIKNEGNRRKSVSTDRELTIPPPLRDIVEKVVFTPQPQLSG
jgi:hypothetical protein